MVNLFTNSILILDIRRQPSNEGSLLPECRLVAHKRKDPPMHKLLILDGHNLLFQMFYGMPNVIRNSRGEAVQGVVGFVGALLKMIKQLEPSHIVAVFDGETENPRTALLPEYKANREDYSQMEEEEIPFSQLTGIYKALDYLGICHFETTDTEADDVIASYALKYGKESEVVIASWDSDYFQLITKQIQVLRYRGKCSTMIDEGSLKEKLGVKACQYADYKAMVGDTADNILGIKGIGPKTAAKLLEEFGCLEDLLENCESIKKSALRKSIAENKARMALNFSLIKLDNHAKIPFPIEELEYNKKEYKTMEVLAEIELLP